jgi:hypothetical protein
MSFSSKPVDINGVQNSPRPFATAEHDSKKPYVIPDVTYGSPHEFNYHLLLQSTNHCSDNRHLKVINIGAGVAGILNAYKIQKNCEKYITSIVQEQTQYANSI